jgi:5' nucleotidase family
VPDEEVLNLYRNRTIPIAYVEGEKGNVRKAGRWLKIENQQSLSQANSRKMVQLADLFSVPEMYLMSTVTEFFTRNHIDYHPEILFRDVKVYSEPTMNFYPKSFYGDAPRFFGERTAVHLKSVDGGSSRQMPKHSKRQTCELFKNFHSSSSSHSMKNAIGSSHPVMHSIVGSHSKEYIHESPNMRKFFERLVNANKKLFLVTNSPFHFVWVFCSKK